MPRTVAAFLALILVSSVTPRAQQAPADAPVKKVAKAAKPAPPTKEQLRLAALKKESSADIDGLATLTQQMVDSVFSFGELGFQEIESSRYLTGILEQPRVQDHARHLGHPDGMGRRMGQRQARHRARLRYRRHPAGLAEAGRRLSRPAGRGRAGTRRGPQLRHTAEHHRRDRREEADGAREAVGHPAAVARSCRGTGRRQGVVRARRAVQGRRHLALHARRQQVRHFVGAAAGHGPGLHRVHLHRSDRTQRGRAVARQEARSTRSS